ncbi:MAG TPA: low affinity iron permease family protein [Pyrinomonadaceae bacterium]|nr:low affinity iron permease family protein [Pyrinomonadaceae bacterium]
MNELFRKFSSKTSAAVGSSWAFMLAITIVIVWAATGPMFNYSDTWQLVINTGTTIITFLMVFLIQNTQNRDAKAIHLKLDELIKATKGAHNSMIDLDSLSDAQLKELEDAYKNICAVEADTTDKDVEVAAIKAIKSELKEREVQTR